MADTVETLLLRALDALQTQLDRLSREVYGNGSPGLKQAVAEIEGGVTHLRELLERHHREDEEAHDRIDALGAQVQELMEHRDQQEKKNEERAESRKFKRDWLGEVLKAGAIVLVTLGINHMAGAG